jgi:energy-coupling factor transporter ATP-binding protein EcfA2
LPDQSPFGTSRIFTTDASLKASALEWLKPPLDLSETTRVANETVDYAIAPIFRAGRAALITGLGASSKSTLLKELAVSVTSGKPTLALNVPKPGKAVLILAEDTSEDAYRSMDAIFQSMKLNDEEIALVHERLFIFAAAGNDCVIVSSEGDKTSLRLEQLINFVQQLGDVRLVGLDPAIALTRGRELDELAQRDLANTVEKIAISTGAAVIVISHAAKSVQYQQEVGSHASRGSGAITDAFRLEVLMRVMTPKEAKGFKIDDPQRHRFVRMQVTKANSLPPELMHPIWLERVNGGALTLANLKPVSVSKPRSALELFFETDEETGEIGPISLSFAAWKLKASDADLLTGKTDSARDMSARRLFTSVRSSKWISDTAGSWKPTNEGVAALLD